MRAGVQEERVREQALEQDKQAWTRFFLASEDYEKNELRAKASIRSGRPRACTCCS